MTERILVAIITGGRPALADRLTRAHADSLRDAGFTDIEWVIREDHAVNYEPDDLPLNTYPVEWASSYARSHWRHPTATWEHSGFFGAFPGREWAMRTAEDRGYDAVLQLDDNVKHIGMISVNNPAYRAAASPGVLARVLAEFALSTNVSMCGAQLNSVQPSGMVAPVRPGYPYSVFIEKCGAGRMPYYGPFEDDIMHALEYALNGGPNRTSGVVDVIRYIKDHSNHGGGMRTQYNNTRGLEIARRYPGNVALGMGNRTSSPNDKSRGIRHFLNTRGFTPVRAVDVPRVQAADAQLRTLLEAGREAKRVWDLGKIRRRAGELADQSAGVAP